MLRHISTYLDLSAIFRAANVENSTITQTEASKRQQKADVENSISQPEAADEAIAEDAI